MGLQRGWMAHGSCSNSGNYFWFLGNPPPPIYISIFLLPMRGVVHSTALALWTPARNNHQLQQSVLRQILELQEKWPETSLYLPNRREEKKLHRGQQYYTSYFSVQRWWPCEQSWPASKIECILGCPMRDHPQDVLHCKKKGVHDTHVVCTWRQILWCAVRTHSLVPICTPVVC